MKVKVNYDKDTTLVMGYYPDDTVYKNIPEPYIEVNAEEHHNNLGKTMCVVDGKYQEYIKPLDVQLKEAKESTISEMKSNRDAYLDSPMISEKAFEYGTDNEVYFRFKVKTTSNTATEPSSILARAHESSSVKYSCTILDNKSERKGYVEITKQVAENLSSHLQLRATSAIQHSNDLAEEINACETLEDLNKIDITF